MMDIDQTLLELLAYLAEARSTDTSEVQGGVTGRAGLDNERAEVGSERVEMEEASGSTDRAGVDDWDMLNVEETQLVSAVKRAMCCWVVLMWSRGSH
jgi:3-dehydroquinate synthase class II